MVFMIHLFNLNKLIGLLITLKYLIVLKVLIAQGGTSGVGHASTRENTNQSEGRNGLLQPVAQGLLPHEALFIVLIIIIVVFVAVTPLTTVIEESGTYAI